MLRERLEANDLTQVLHNLPAGDWGRASAASPACRTASENFATASARRSTMRRRWIASRSTALPASCLPGRTSASFATPWSATFNFAADELEKQDIKLLIEPINTIDIPGFYLNRTEQAIELIDEVGSNNLFIQYDVYHMQIMEGDLARTVAEEPLADRPYPARRQSRSQRAGHR